MHGHCCLYDRILTKQLLFLTAKLLLWLSKIMLSGLLLEMAMMLLQLQSDSGQLRSKVQHGLIFGNFRGNMLLLLLLLLQLLP